jgi:MFS family permease
MPSTRWAIAASFGLTGLVFATWAARIPARKAELQLSDGELALAFVGLNAGAVAGLQLGGLVVLRLGSRRAIAAGLPAFAALLLPLAWAPSLAWLTGALALSAAVNSVIDVAINEQGVSLQQQYGRSLLSGFHAMHSLGGVVGGGLAALAARAQWSVASHFALTAVAVTAVAAVAARGLLPRARVHAAGPVAGNRAALRDGWTPELLVLGGLAFVFTLAEGSALDWSAVLLHDYRDAGPAVAAAALAVFQCAVTIGRLAGDRLIDRTGPVRVFRAGALLAGGGFAAGLLTGTAAGALAGLALLGLGLATLLPIAIAAGADGRGVSVPVAVARVSTLGYLGSFTGPLIIGGLAGLFGLPAALTVAAVAVAATAGVARAVRPEDAGPGPVRAAGTGGRCARPARTRRRQAPRSADRAH